MSKAADASGTPLMQQYREIKSRHRDAILFFRMGDFYEMFFDDAEVAARVLNITLTARGDGVPLAGVPVKAAADYLRQFIAAGFRVAICEQVEDPKKAKGLVKREVTRVVSPGTFTDAGYLDAREPAFLAAVAQQGLCQPGAVAVLATAPRVCHRAIKVRAVAAMPPWSVVPTATHPRRRGHQEAGRDPGPAGRRGLRRRTGALPPVTALHHQQVARVTGGRLRTDQPPSRRNPRRGVVRRRQAQVHQPTIRHLPAGQGRTRPLTRPIERQEIHDER